MTTLVPLLLIAPGQLDQGLQEVEEEGVLAQPAGIQVVVDFGDVARLPEVHQAVDLVDERGGMALGVVAHGFPLPLMPRTELHDAPRPLLGLGVGTSLLVRHVCLAVILR